jgi:lipopolysaccharide export system protein LptC
MTEYVEVAPEPPRRRLRYDPRASGGEAAYRAAQRHSQVVRWLKYVLPGLAIVGALVFWASARVINSDLAGLIAAAQIDSKSNSVVMDKPHISGFEGTRRAYEVKADSASQSLDDPKVVTFHKIDAHVGLEDAGVATIGASVGVYNGNNNVLELKDGISIETNTGYAASFESASVDLGKGSLSSSRPIEIRTSEGNLRANAIEVVNRGKKIVFSGGVSVTYLPPAELAAPGGAAAQ